MPRKTFSLFFLLTLTVGGMAVSAPAGAQSEGAGQPVVREAEAVVLTGNLLPGWSGVATQGAALPHPQGALIGERDAHGGTLAPIPAEAQTGVDPDSVAAYRWDGTRFVEIPVQVDERFPYFLANPNSDFGIYSGTDEELTYAWDVESWKKTHGTCFASYGPGEGAMPDPVAKLDDDDEIVFMASDAGGLAPPTAARPIGADATYQQVAVTDPLDPSNVRFVYLFLRPGGSSFDASNGYVRYQRDANADQWIDRSFFADNDPEKIGTSNTGYGPNLSGTVCPDGTPATAKNSNDRFPRDGVTVTTDAYRWRATGRWMVRDMQVAKPGQPHGCMRENTCEYGPDLIDRWKGRAFQQSPDSTISLVGFEDEQVNWEANAALLGERTGPVRAIRETWGADSGTNVTKTETFYRDAVAYRYHLRVHPIPPDGIYTSWDNNAGVATKYYNTFTVAKDAATGAAGDVDLPAELNGAGVGDVKGGGVDIDGINDDVGNVDGVGDFPAFFDAPDPTFNVLSSTNFWEQVSGREDSGSLVYIVENKGQTSAENPLAFPYYRDDKCLDDGTGDDPVQRPWPGESSTDQRVKDGYAAMAGKPYDQVTCDEKQGAWGSHGLHIFFTNDTDNAFQPKPATEVDAQQWQFAVPTDRPHAVGEGYANNVRVPLKAAGTPLLSQAEGETTTLQITGPSAATINHQTTLSAKLTGAGNTALAGRTVRFEFQDKTYEGATGNDGVATATALVAAPAGPNPLEATYAGDDFYRASSATSNVEVGRDVSTLAFENGSASSGQITDGVHLVGRLSDSAGPIGGAPVRLTLQGSTQTSNTNAQGLVAFDPVLKGPAGQHTARLDFLGDASREPSSAERSITVTKDDSRIAFQATPGKKNQATVNVTLTDRDSGAGLAGQRVEVSVKGTVAGTITTNANGTGSLTVSVPKGGNKKPPPVIRVAYAGNDGYNGTAAQGTYGSAGASGSS